MSHAGITENGKPDGFDTAGAAELPEEGSPSVQDHLEMALEVAREQEMSTSELVGIFFYYAHSIAESYRQEVLARQADMT